MTSHFGASGGQQTEGAATQSMPLRIVEERQCSRWRLLFLRRR